MWTTHFLEITFSKAGLLLETFAINSEVHFLFLFLELYVCVPNNRVSLILLVKLALLSFAVSSVETSHGNASNVWLETSDKIESYLVINIHFRLASL